jgi:hypothetical protein
VSGRGDELRELVVGHGSAVDPEAIDCDGLRGTFFRVVVIGTHDERATVDPLHGRLVVRVDLGR